MRDADVVVLDARRFDEYQTMSIPGGVSVPGAELVYRVGGSRRAPRHSSSSTAPAARAASSARSRS